MTTAARAAAQRAPPRLLALLLACLALCAPAAHAQPRGLGNTTVRSIALSSVAACRPATAAAGAAAGAIPAGLGSNCMLEGIVGADETIEVTFDVGSPTAPRGSSAGSFDLMVQARTVDGITSLGIVTPEGGQADGVPDFLGRTLYSTISSAEEFIPLTGKYLRKFPGRYKILVTNAMDRPAFYNLQVQTPLSNTMLADSEVEVMLDLQKQCCGANSQGQFCQMLPAALDPDRSPEDDLCRFAPLTCNRDGQLQQLVLPSDSIDCGGQGLPESFGDLEALQTLDLAYNAVGGDAGDLAAILSSMPSLERAFLRGTNITGELDCAMVENPSMVLLSVTGNTQLTGGIPDCFFNDPTLEELYMSDTGLEGTLPDVIPVGSPLRTLFIINTGIDGSPAHTGPMPASLINAANLTYLDLSNNELEGPMPPLPPGLVVLNVSNNDLTSLPPTLPPRLEMLDASFNDLEGTIPTLGRDLLILNLEDNEMSGELPAFSTEPPSTAGIGVAGRRRVARRLQQLGMVETSEAEDSEDEEEDPRDASAPQLRVAYLGANELTGAVPAEWTTAPRMMQVLDLGDNYLEGELPDTWDLPRLAILNLAKNSLQGSLPTGIAALPSAIFIDAHLNQLGGELGPFADSLVSGGSRRLMHLDLSDNRFEGPIPPAFASTSILNSSSLVMLNGIPAPRVLDLSNNYFSGAVFPMELVAAIPEETKQCRCRIIAIVNGPNAALACPTSAEAAAAGKLGEPERELLGLYKFNCTAGNGERVPLLRALDGKFAGPAARSWVAPPPLDGAGGKPSGGGGGGGGWKSLSKAAQIAIIVSGSVVIAALLIGIAVCACVRTRHQRAGWAKDPALEGSGPPGGAPSKGPSRLRGAGWGARSAARDVEAGAFGLMPAPGAETAAAAALPPSARAASGALEMARSASSGPVRHGGPQGYSAPERNGSGGRGAWN
ncbi:MAG: hypothetical protein J3K34DRAFT_409790 [Monoraphidium minutum]|nr:MAG: hypothetical protein J3K34DRAFT_409790 [Monoraphidium minutum]